MSDYHEGLEEGIKIGKAEAAARIAELEAALLVLETEIVKLDLDYLDFLRVGRIINAALEGGKS